MSLIAPPDLDHIDPALHADYEAARERHIHFDALRRVLLRFSAASRAVDGMYDLIMERGQLLRELKEQIFLVCSAARGCEYATTGHGQWLREHTELSEADVDSLVRGEDLPLHTEVERQVLAFGRKVAAAPYRTVSDDIARLRAAGFDEPEIVEITTVISLSGWMNGYAEAFGLTDEDVNGGDQWH